MRLMSDLPLATAAPRFLPLPPLFRQLRPAAQEISPQAAPPTSTKPANTHRSRAAAAADALPRRHQWAGPHRWAQWLLALEEPRGCTAQAAQLRVSGRRRVRALMHMHAHKHAAHGLLHTQASSPHTHAGRLAARIAWEREEEFEMVQVRGAGPA